MLVVNDPRCRLTLICLRKLMEINSVTCPEAREQTWSGFMILAAFSYFLTKSFDTAGTQCWCKHRNVSIQHFELVSWLFSCSQLHCWTPEEACRKLATVRPHVLVRAAQLQMLRTYYQQVCEQASWEHGATCGRHHVPSSWTQWTQRLKTWNQAAAEWMNPSHLNVNDKNTPNVYV